MMKVENSYTKYFNTKHNRVGPLLQGPFKAVTIENENQLVHVSRYIHLNPYVADLVKNLDEYPYSSYQNYVFGTNEKLCITDTMLSFFKNPKEYKAFIDDHASYALELERIKHLVIEN